MSTLNRILGGLRRAWDVGTQIFTAAAPILRTIASLFVCRWYVQNSVINMALGTLGSEAEYATLHTATEREVIQAMKLNITFTGDIFNEDLQDLDTVPVVYAFALLVVRDGQTLPKLALDKPQTVSETVRQHRGVVSAGNGRRRMRTNDNGRLPDNPAPVVRRQNDLVLHSVTDQKVCVLKAFVDKLIGYEVDSDEGDQQRWNTHPADQAAVHKHEWGFRLAEYPGPVLLNPGDRIIAAGFASDNLEKPTSPINNGPLPKAHAVGTLSWDLYKETVNVAQITEYTPQMPNSVSVGRFSTA